MTQLRLVLLVFAVSLTSACSWFGNKDNCADGVCDTNPVITTKPGETQWYCYGVSDDRSWDCGHTAQPEKIQSVAQGRVPEAQQPAAQQPAAVTPATLPSTRALPPPDRPQSRDATESILALPADSYVVQLIAMRDGQNVLAFAAAQGIEAPIVVRVVDGDTGWHLLLLGTYPDRASAEAARTKWESSRTLDIKPWVRRLETLQQAIRAGETGAAGV